MVQVNSDSNKIKENKYKILRMSLLLGNGDDREETINNFEDAAREIDAMNDEVYLKDLDGKFYDTFKLEEEEKKLSVLVDYIGGRVEQRMSLVEDFLNVTGYELVNLPIIKYQDRLDEYKSRLRYIREYLGNTKRINKLNEEINDFENKLNDCYVRKSKAEGRNLKIEEDLFSRFKNVVGNLDLFKNITMDNIDSKLNEVIGLTADSKKSLDIFNKSFSTLSQAGISDDEKNEYLSYVADAKEVFYANKEQEYLLRIYSLLCKSESEYSNIISKRNSLNELIYERLNLRKDLNVHEADILSSIYDLLDRQYDEIKEESINISNIDNYIKEIDTRRIEVNSLEQDNQKVEILSLLREFCIIDTYDDVGTEVKDDLKNDNVVDESISDNESYDDKSDNINEVESVKETNVFDADDIFSNTNLNTKSSSDVIEDKNDNVVVSNDVNSSLDDNKENEVENFDVENDYDLDIDNPKDNQVILIDDANSMDIDVATSKSNDVMIRVGEMLGVKSKNDNVVDKVENYNNSNEEGNIEKEEIVENDTGKSVIPGDIFDNNNYDADPEIKDNSNGVTDSDLNISGGENPFFSSDLSNTTLDEVMANNKVDDNVDNDFWYSNEEAPLDLNSLPDLTVNDDIFGTKVDENLNDNNMPSLDFPDLDASGLDGEDK